MRQSNHLPLFCGQPTHDTFWGLLILHSKQKHLQLPKNRTEKKTKKEKKPKKKKKKKKGFIK